MLDHMVSMYLVTVKLFPEWLSTVHSTQQMMKSLTQCILEGQQQAFFNSFCFSHPNICLLVSDFNLKTHTLNFMCLVFTYKPY